jgi:hypothetical protein
MADIVLGQEFRKNFGLLPKYDINLDPIYKGYIDTLEHSMIAAAYSNNGNLSPIVQTMDLNISQQDIDSCIGEIRYAVLEPAIINFCQKHDVDLTIQRNGLNIVVTINMLNKFHVTYA